MKHHKALKYMLMLLAIMLAAPVWSQWPTRQSVLADHSWYKIGVTADGVYGLDYATLRDYGIDVQQMNPSAIRLYGNLQGALPESNATSRHDDLTEIAIQVTGADDGSFDDGDCILFYGQGPVKLTWTEEDRFCYERNLYSDTVFYFLCFDGVGEGLRIADGPVVPTTSLTPRVNMYPDCYYHESEELSPYASGRVWFGDLFTRLDGYKEFQMEFPGLIPSEGMWVESKIMGRCKPVASYCLTLNDEILVAHQEIAAFGEREYGRVYTENRLSHPLTNQIKLRYSFDPGEGNPMLFIDYFVLSFWRNLQYHNQPMSFHIVSSQLTDRTSRVEVGGANSSTICWEVSNPLHPVRQLTEPMDGGVCFGLGGQTKRCFQLFEVGDLKTVASFRSIANQNLHGIESADMIIITPRVFWEQAQALALFHAERDGMDCVITDVDEIYNEFSTGMTDPTALRDMIRMVYLRSEGRLKYVLLLGKGTHDFRNIKGLNNNFVPTYENLNSPCSEVASQCTDDYFAMMDADEGDNCEGKVDLGVGRIPITTPEQGDAVMEKIRHYTDLDATHGPWKNNHLFMADNDTKLYANYAEVLASIIDTACPMATVKKIYLDSYPVMTTPSGVRAPLAHQALMEQFDEGMHVMSYTGHGGVKNLSGEWVLALSDILALDNYDKLPFIHTATCEFSKFDKPDLVSGGELLMLSANGGAIALLTTVRPTQPMTNQLMSRSVASHLYEKLDGQSLRFGDFYRIVKSDPAFYKKANTVYVLMGDPALRMSYPTHRVETEQIHGDDLITVKGRILDAEGVFDPMFNGVLDVRLYDQKTQYKTLGQYDTPVEYSYYNDVLFEGKASVAEGRFEMVVPLPSSVSQGNGKTRLSYYAYDSIRKIDANGIYDGYPLTVPLEVVDTKGPDIRLYWNTPEFESGDTVAPTGTLFADLFDEHGIYHYNVSIGRDIVMKSNITDFNGVILNDRYEPVLDDYRRGRITIPFGEMENGVYEFSLKAWDTWNNPTEVEMVMVVNRNTMLAQIKSFPNPFEDEVFFSFVDGELNEDLEVRLEVFDVMGRRVATHDEHTSAVSGIVPLIRWDGKADGGHALRSGVYAYKLSITDSSGRTRAVTHRLIKK